MKAEDFYKMPAKVQFVHIMAASNQPIGISLYQEVLDEHPEYFPEEVEHQKKWRGIPQDVHDAYWKEYWELDKEIMKDVPPSKGLVYYCSHQKESVEYRKKLDEAIEKGKPLRKALHDKYYGKYGV